jgi:hypothetical protein
MLGSSQPKPGDMSVCIECGFVSVFTRKMRLRVPTKAEIWRFQPCSTASACWYLAIRSSPAISRV